MKRLITSILVAGAMVCGGCDDSSTSVPPAVLEAASRPPDNIPKAPTTQDLLSGRRSRTALIPLPLTADLPPGWGLLKKGSLPSLLQGYTATGEVQIQLTLRPSMKQDEMDRMVNGAKKEKSENPQQIVKVDLREHNGMKIFERQKVGHPAPFTTFDKNNQPHTTTESNYTWTIMALVPHEGAFQVYELNFIGLTKSQYDREQQFLTEVISTLDYAGDDVARPGATTLPTPPAPTTLPATAPGAS